MNRYPLSSLVGLLTFLAIPSLVQAQLVLYDFENANDRLGAASSSVGLIASSFGAGSGVTTPTTPGGAFPAGNAGGTSYSQRAWTTSSERDLLDYFYFSVTPEVGYTMSLTSLAFDEQALGFFGGQAIPRAQVYSSLDGYAVPLITLDLIADQWGPRYTVSLDGSFADLTSEVEFRIYAYGTSSEQSSAWRIDNVELFGTVTAVPEPATVALLAGGLLWLVGRRFRPRC